MAGLASGKLILGDSNGDPAAATMSGDATLSNTGALTIADNAVSLAKMAGLAAGRFILGDSNGDPAAVELSGDATVSAAGALTIAADAVEHSMLNDNCISGFDDIGAAIVATDEFLISDAGTLKRTDMSRLATYVGNNLASNNSTT